MTNKALTTKLAPPEAGSTKDAKAPARGVIAAIEQTAGQYIEDSLYHVNYVTETPVYGGRIQRLAACTDSSGKDIMFPVPQSVRAGHQIRVLYYVGVVS